MSRCAVICLLALFLLGPRLLHATDDGPTISITSPDAATTYAFGRLKDRSLFWDNKNKLLFARVVFTNDDFDDVQPQDDQHNFRLPGVSFDATKGIFYAVSAKGETIPVARMKKTLFFKTIEILPNAHVSIEYPHGNVTVTLEAIRPEDPAMHAPPPGANPDDTHTADIKSILH
jgi:hypothetical protein